MSAPAASAAPSAFEPLKSKTMIGRLFDLHHAAGRFLERVVEPVFNLGARIWIGKIFFDSGLAKLNKWREGGLQAVADLFEKFHPVPPLPPKVAAVLGTGTELILPVLLVLGLFTRLPAAGLLFMAFVIEFVSARTAAGLEAGISNPQHILWMFILGYLVIRGGGPLSVDRIFKRDMRT